MVLISIPMLQQLEYSIDELDAVVFYDKPF
jgi:hypothetical protein